MKSKEELAKEYRKFVEDVLKASKDFSDAVNGLAPENLERFKCEMRTILPAGIVNLFQILNS